MKNFNTLRIRRIDHLCKLLHCSQDELENITAKPELYYKQFPISKKGKIRHCAEPCGRLREILDNLNKLLQHIELPAYLHGGVKNHSTRTNAIVHIGKPAILGFDIEDFFPSIKPEIVYRLFYQRLECFCEVSKILMLLVTLNNEIPHGSPTSTTIANLVITPLAERIKKLAEAHNANYTQFVDDGTISGSAYLEKLRPLIDKIIRQEGFRPSPKPSKRKTTFSHEEQVVTGIRVNQQVDIPREKLQQAKSKILNLAQNIENRGSVLFQKEVASLKGLIRYISSLNHGAGKHLHKKLNQILQDCV